MNDGKRNFLAVSIITAFLFMNSTAGHAVPSASPLALNSAMKKQVTAAQKMLNAIRVTTSADPRDYDRDFHFGDAWVDVENNRCDTRNDILRRDLTNEVFDGSCTILSGVLKDPYTGKTINFKRGVSTSLAVQIDHVIPLHLAWQYGAANWTLGKRVAFANDPINLIAVDGPTNSRKSDSGPDEWLPPREKYQCTYSIRFIRVAYLYQVKITPASKSALASELKSCAVVYGKPALLSPLSKALWPRAAEIA